MEDMRLKNCKQCGTQYMGRIESRFCSLACSNKSKWRDKRESGKQFTFISCGGGFQSSAMLAMVCSGKLERPDAVIMVDAGYEKREVMEYVNTVLRPACDRIGLDFILLLPDRTDIVSDSGVILLPALIRKPDGSVGKMPTRCNDQWKVRTVKKYLRSIGVGKATALIGISTDESHRIKSHRTQWYSTAYPLLAAGMSRYDCLFAVRSAGWPDPIRSSCVFCPQHPDEEWESIASDPDNLAVCIDVDNEIERVNPDVFLHRSMRRLRDVVWRVRMA
jgi:hypothetical protein